MSTEILAVIIPAIVTITGVFIKLLTDNANLKIERNKLKENTAIEREKLRLERIKFEAEQKKSIEEIRLQKAEIDKLNQEGHKLSCEADEINNRRLDAKRSRTQSSNSPFDLMDFEDALENGNPVDSFKALCRLHNSLQLNRGLISEDYEIAEHIQCLRDILRSAEAQIRNRFPIIVMLASDYKPTSDYEQQKQIQENLGEDFNEPVRLMLGVRQELTPHLNAIQKRMKH